MPSTLDRKQHIKLNEDQLEIPPASAAFTEDFEGQVSSAQARLELLQAQRGELERQKLALEELNHRKQEFLNGQLELSEKFSNAITMIERELFESKQEMEDLDQTRAAFANHLNRIENLNPEAWPKEKLNSELQKALSTLDKAEDEYEQAVSYFTGTRNGSLFGGQSRSIHGAHSSSEFQTMVRNGLAFNLPIVILGTIALLAYLAK